MTVKLILLKSGEDIIADISEMSVGEEENRRVIGYFLEKPCIVKMIAPKGGITKGENDGIQKTAGFEVSLFPWMPLSKDTRIPIPADWLITIVEPVQSLSKMYTEDIIKYAENNKNSSTDEQSDSDQSD